MYFGRGDAVPAELITRAAAARRARAEANRSAACGDVPINRRGCMITDSRPPKPRPVRLEATARDKRIARAPEWMGRTVSEISAAFP